MLKKILIVILFIFLEIVFLAIFILLIFGNGSIGSNFLYLESKIEFVFFRMGLGITFSSFWSTMNYLLIDFFLVEKLKPVKFISYSMLIMVFIFDLFLFYAILSFKHQAH
jgi:hypothetical protein